MKKKIFWTFSLKHAGGFLLGAFLLSAFSMVQKKVLGLSFSLTPQAFLIPILFGGISGLALSITYLHLRASRERMRDFLNNMDDIVQIIDREGNFIFVNKSWHRTLGYSPIEIKELKVFDIIEPAHVEECRLFFNNIFSGEKDTKDYKTVFISKGGEKIYLEGKINCRFVKGEALSTRAVFRNISEKRKAREFQKTVASIFEKTQEGVAITNAERIVSFINRAFTVITGCTEEEAVGQYIHKLLPSVDGVSDINSEAIKLTLTKDEYWHGETWSIRKNKEEYPIEITINAIANAKNEITNYAYIFSDISKRKESEMRLKHLATHDGLTDLPNRETFYACAKDIILEAKEKTQKFAILFLDLDGFKYVNDQYGHHSGDILLKLIAKRLQNHTREEDIVARFGGDEFIILLQRIKSIQGAKERAERILIKLEEPYNLDGITIQITASIGISLYKKDDQIDTLLIGADKAMYTAKKLGKNRVYFIER